MRLSLTERHVIPLMWSRLRTSHNMIALIAFSGAALLAMLVAYLMALVIENRSTAAVRARLDAAAMTWASVERGGAVPGDQPGGRGGRGEPGA
jgi:hypothetical protein